MLLPLTLVANMCARRNLYSSETNQTYVSLLLEMFSNIIQYQYTGNARLVYAIVRRQEVSCGLNDPAWFCFGGSFHSVSFFCRRLCCCC